MKNSSTYYKKFRYFVVYKPFQMLCQFSKEQESQLTLADLGFPFPIDAYPVGRLDADSEGLLVISNDKKLVDKMLNPENQKSKTYWVQVEGLANISQIELLSAGVEITIEKKKYKTLAASAKLLDDVSEQLPTRNPPIRFRASVPTSWVEIEITEGKNRQVRKMCAAVGLPVLRLVRAKLANFDILSLNLTSGQVLEVSEVNL